jgi:hypothetical protein
MEFNKEYFLNQLRNGTSIDEIGNALADAMNAAQDEYRAEQDVAKARAAQVEADKRNIIEDMLCLFQEYADVIGAEVPDDMFNCSGEDIDALVGAMDELFKMIASLDALKHDLQALNAAVPAKTCAGKVTLTPTNPGSNIGEISPIRPTQPKCELNVMSDDDILSNFLKLLS